MSVEVDNRIVEMRFDNAQFEKNVSTSIKTLDDLKESLKFEESAKSVEEVSKNFSAMTVALGNVASNLINKVLDPLENKLISMAKGMSIDQITGGFTKYETELKSVQMIMNATGDSIENVTKSLDKLSWYADETSYSYDSMVTNVGKFTAQGIDIETSATAMQGIANMAGLAGASVTDATHAMEGFSKAMAAGSMKLQNWKWIQTAHMETVATKQAFIDAAEAVGTLKKVEEGYYEDVKGNIVNVQTFTETLKDGWMSAEAMSKALSDMGSFSDLIYNVQKEYTELTGKTILCSQAMKLLTKDQKTLKDVGIDSAQALTIFTEASKNLGKTFETTEEAEKAMIASTKTLSAQGYAASQEYRSFKDAIDATADAASTAFKDIFKNLFGNAEESKQIWTELGETMFSVFVQKLQDIAAIVKEFHDDFRGFSRVLQTVQTAIESLSSIIAPFKSAIEDIFPLPTAERIATFVERVKHFFEIIALTEEESNNLTDSLKELLSPLEFVKKAFDAAKKVILFTVIGIKELGVLIAKHISQSQGVREAVGLVGKIISNVAEILGYLFKTIANSPITSKVLGAIATAITSISKALGGGLLTVLRFLAKLDLSNISNFFKSIKDSMSKDGNYIGINLLKGIGEGIKNGLSGLIDRAKSIATTIVETVQNLLGIHSASRVFKKIGSYIIEGLQIGIETGSSVLKRVWDAIEEPLKRITNNFDITRIATLALGSAFAITALRIANSAASLMGSLAKIGKSVTGLINAATGVVNEVKGLVKNVSKVLTEFGKAEKLKAVASIIRSLALSLAVLAASLIAISFVPADKLKTAGNAIAQLVGVMVLAAAAFAAIKKLFGSKSVAPASGGDPFSNFLNSLATPITKFIDGIKKGALIVSFGTCMALLGVAVLLMSKAVKQLGELYKSGELVAGGIALSAMLGFVIGLGFVLKATKDQGINENVGKFGIAMVKIALATTIMAKTISTLGELYKSGDLIPGGLALTGILGFFIGFGLVLKGANGINENISKFGSMLIKMAVAITLLCIPIKILSSLWKSGELLIGFIATSTLIGFFILFGKVLAKAQGTGINENISKFGSMLIKMAVALSLLCIPIKILGSMNHVELGVGIVAIGLVMMLFTAFAAILNQVANFSGDIEKFGKVINKFGTAMIAISAAVLLMTAPIKILGSMDLGQLGLGVAAVTVLLALFAGLAAVAGLCGDDTPYIKFAVSIAIISGSLFIVSGILAMMQGWDTKKAILSALALASVMAGIGVAFKLAGDIKLSAAASLAIVQLSLLSLVPVFETLAKLNANQLISSVGAIVVVVGMIGAFMAILGNIGPMAALVGAALAAVIASLYLLAKAIEVISNINAKGLNDILSVFIELNSGGKLALTILEIGGALIVLGSGCVVAGAGLIMLGAGLVIIGLAAGLFALLAASLAKLMDAMQGFSTMSDEQMARVIELFKQFSQVIPILAESVGTGIVLISDKIREAAPYIMEAVSVIMTGIITTITQNGPKIYAMWSTIFGTAVETVRDNAPKLGEAFVTLVDTIATKILEAVPSLMEKLKLAVASVVSGLIEMAPLVTYVGLAMIGEFVIGLSAGGVAISNAAGAAVLNFIVGLAAAIDKYGPKIKLAGNLLMREIAEQIAGKDTADLIYGSAEDIVAGIKEGIGDNLEGAFVAGQELGKAVSDGANDALDISSPSRVLANTGAFAARGLAEGVYANIGNVYLAGERTGEALESAVKEGSDKMGDHAKTGMEAVATEVEEGGILASIKGLLAGSEIGQQLLEGLESKGGLIESFISGITDKVSSFEGIFASAKQSALGDSFMNSVVKNSAEKYNNKMKINAALAGKNSSGGGSSSAKEAEKSIEELAKMYSYGESVIKKFSETYGKSILAIDATADVTKIATAAVDNLAIELYKLSDTYNEDLKNAELNTETILQHISEAFNEVYNTIANDIRSIDIFSDFDDGTSDVSSSVVSSSSDIADANEEAEKSIEELTYQYHYGEKVVEAFTDKYSKSIKALDKTADVSSIASKAINTLSVRLYQLSDTYEEDMNNADLTAEDVLANIQNAFETTFNNIKSSISSIDIFSALTKQQETSAQAMIENAEEQMKAINDYRENLAKVGSLNISDNLKQYLSGLGIGGAHYVEAFANATEEELVSLNKYYSDFLAEQDNVGEGFMSTWAANLTGLDQSLANGSKDIVSTFTTNFQSQLDAAVGVVDPTAMATDIVDRMRTTLSSGLTQIVADMKAAQEEAERIEAETKAAQEAAAAESNKSKKKTISDYIDSAEQWNEAIEEYSQNLTTIASNANIDMAFKQYLQQLGFNQREMIAAIAEGNDEEIEELQSLYLRQQTLADEAATNSLTGWANSMANTNALLTDGVSNITQNFIQGFQNGLDPNAGTSQVTQMAINSLTAMRTALGIHSPSTETFAIGVNFVLGYINGCKSEQLGLNIYMRLMAAEMIDYFKNSISEKSPDLVSQFKTLGSNMMSGLSDGIAAGRSGVIGAAVSVAIEAYQAACDALDVNSPSKKFRWIGQMVDKGLLKGIQDDEGQVVTAADKMAEDTLEAFSIIVKSLNDSLEDGMDTNPVITPVLDLSNITSGIREMNALLNDSNSLSGIIQNGSGGTNNYSFVQNNYSPKALSRIDIYRQTKNQFSMMKGAK